MVILQGQYLVKTTQSKSTICQTLTTGQVQLLNSTASTFCNSPQAIMVMAPLMLFQYLEQGKQRGTHYSRDLFTSYNYFQNLFNRLSLSSCRITWTRWPRPLKMDSTSNILNSASLYLFIVYKHSTQINIADQWILHSHLYYRDRMSNPPTKIW